jgi:hypothetical protein
MSDNTISQDGTGFLVGVQPAQPQVAIVAEPRPDQAVSQPPIQVVDQAPPNTNGNGAGTRFYTQEELEAARKQEKDKLYGRIEEMSTTLRTLQEERQAEAAERQRLADEAEAARRATEEQEMDLRTLMEQREAALRNELTTLNERYEMDRAVFERERLLQEAYAYRVARIEQEQEYILPELRDLIGGDTPEAVDASIEEMKMRSEAIFNNMAAAAQPQPFRGAAMPSVPPVGPMEQVPQLETLTAQDIQGMDMTTYKKYRERLLQSASRQQRGR